MENITIWRRYTIRNIIKLGASIEKGGKVTWATQFDQIGS